MGAVLVAVLLGLGACTSSNAQGSAPPVQVVWSVCAGGLRCARVQVPVDYGKPQGAMTSLALTELPTIGAKGDVEGVLFVDLGGPGENGGQGLRLLGSLFPQAIRQHFDIVAMDRRGTGDSSKLECGPTPDQVVGASLASSSLLVGIYQRTLSACLQAQGSIGTADTVTAAKDLDRVRQAMGLSRIDFLGLSYGTVLGQAYLQRFPHHVRAMILDGAVNPDESLMAAAGDQAAVQERDLTSVLAACTPASCGLGPDPVGAYDQLRQRLAASPLPAPAVGQAPVGSGDLAAATLTYLTVPNLTPGYFPALAAAIAGNGAKLRAVATTLYTDLDGTSVLGPYWATTCEDSTTRPSKATFAHDWATFAARYPDLGAGALAYGVAGCVGWPSPTQPMTTKPVSGAPPVVVIGGTQDPQTPVAWARHVVAELGPGTGRLVVRENPGHTAFLNQSVPCVINLEVAYLVRGIVPDHVTTCPGG